MCDSYIYSMYDCAVCGNPIKAYKFLYIKIPWQCPPKDLNVQTEIIDNETVLYRVCDTCYTKQS